MASVLGTSVEIFTSNLSKEQTVQLQETLKASGFTEMISEGDKILLIIPSAKMPDLGYSMMDLVDFPAVRVESKDI